MICFDLCGSFTGLDCESDPYQVDGGVTVTATLGTAERCLPLMDGGTLEVIDMDRYETTQLFSAGSWTLRQLPANIGTNPADRVSPQGSWYDIIGKNHTSGKLLFGPVRIQLDADAGYEVDANGCVNLWQVLTSGFANL